MIKRITAYVLLAFTASLTLVVSAGVATAATNPQVPYCSEGVMFQTGDYCTKTTDTPTECVPYVAAWIDAYNRFVQDVLYRKGEESGILRSRVVYWSDRAYKDERKIDQQAKQIRRLKHQLANR